MSIFYVRYPHIQNINFKNSPIVLSILFTFLFSWSIQAWASLDIQYWKSNRGIDVYYVHAPQLPMVDIQVIFDAGSSRDGDKPGLAMLTNGLLNQGASGMDANAISQEIESLGAVLGLGINIDFALVGLRSLTEPPLLKKALKTFKQVLTEPDFPKNALERLRSQQLITLRSKQQSPATLTWDAFMDAAYKGHPYSQPIDGNEGSIRSISLEEIVSFYKRYYVASNMKIAIVGAIDRKDAEQIVEELTSGFEQGKQAESIISTNSLKKANSIFIEYPSLQTHILVGQPGLKYHDPDYFPLYVGNHILGGGGMVSRLFEEIREKRGLSYSAYSHFYPMRFQGPFTAGLQTKAEQAEEALNVLMGSIKKFIEEGPEDSELVTAKKNITGGYPLLIDSNKKILRYIVIIAYYGLPFDYLETFNSNIEAVTIEQIQDAFKRRLLPDRMITVMLGSSSAKEDKTDR